LKDDERDRLKRISERSQRKSERRCEKADQNIVIVSRGILNILRYRKTYHMRVKNSNIEGELFVQLFYLAEEDVLLSMTGELIYSDESINRSIQAYQYTVSEMMDTVLPFLREINNTLLAEANELVIEIKKIYEKHGSTKSSDPSGVLISQSEEETSSVTLAGVGRRIHRIARKISNLFSNTSSWLSSNAHFLVFMLLLLISPTQSLEAQQPAKGGGNLVPFVHKIKEQKLSVHLEWLYLEDRFDWLQQQREIVRSRKPLEFTSGYLYHGRDGLDEILLSNRIAGESYFTRAPHVWAIEPFIKTSKSPAIFRIDAIEFNRLRNEGKAVLEAEIDYDYGIMDPYPKVKDGFPLQIVSQIWIDQDTWERYERLIAPPDFKLSEQKRRLKLVVKAWRNSKKLIVFSQLRHKQLDKNSFYPVAFEIIGAYVVHEKLYNDMPQFKIRENTVKTREDTHKIRESILWPLIIGILAIVGIGTLVGVRYLSKRKQARLEEVHSSSESKEKKKRRKKKRRR